MSHKAVLRITREISSIQKGGDLSLAVACRDTNVREIKAMIIGPPDTPYEFGFFDFNVKFPPDYPESAPSVTATTTNGGRTRFNPNIYAGGKVCLSILGTWRGERGEEWSSAQGLESILISIQSLMSGNPYENEPGFESIRTKDEKKNAEEYAAKIQHETLRISIIQRMENYLSIYSDGTVAPAPALELSNTSEDEDIDDPLQPFEPFRDLCKRRFLWYYDSYLNTITTASLKRSNGEEFVETAFEGSSNTMKGRYYYPELERRLRLIRKVLDDETARWALEGALHVRRDTPLGSSMMRTYKHVVEQFNKNDVVTLDIDLKKEDNPFVWRLTYFGRPMTQLDGGMFEIIMSISPRFPDEQPRVKFETQLFHHRVSKEGILCYLPRRPDDLLSHIEAIVAAIEEEHPPYDPRTLVNLEASKLFWGSVDDKKQYNRLLRRAVQRSTEG